MVEEHELLDMGNDLPVEGKYDVIDGLGIVLQRHSALTAFVEIPPVTPNGSPQSSPVPTTKNQHKREPSITGSTESVPERSDSSNSQKVSPPAEGSTSKIPDVVSADEIRRLSSEQLPCGELPKSNSQEPKKTKSKKTPWTWLYPTYKSRSDDFKRLFKDIPVDERLVVDYSCAIQRDILVHGRLYVSPNYLCFYANIFRWETQVVFKWKEVTALTKEKTALVIPNAIFVHIGNEKHFLTSFAARDKAYLMLFRVWQNALMDQPMSTQEMWTWVHQCYGEELGLTSDDDDYVAPPATIDGELLKDEKDYRKKNLNNNKKDSSNDISEHLTNESEKNVDKNSNPHISSDGSTGTNDNVGTVIANPSGLSASDQPQSDVSDSSGSESESEKIDKPLGATKCPAAHEGRLMLHMQVAIHVDQLFSHLFTNSKFLLDLHDTRKSTDVKQSAWTVNPSTNQKVRTVSCTVALASIGPKHAQVTESQKMLPYSKPGEIYSIEIEAYNAGVPYADTFYVITHYCLTRGSDANTSTITVYCQIKYRKSVWGIVKSYIEKHCWQGIEDYFNDLVKALELECERTRRTMTSLPGTKRKGIRRRRSGVLKTQVLPIPDIEKTPLVQPLVLPTQTAPHLPHNADTLAWIVFLTLFLLLVLNAALYYKLWGLEQSERRLSDPTSDLDMDNFRFAPRTPEEWRTLLQKQEQLHGFEVERWLRILKASVHLLQQVETSLTGLQESIQGVMGDVLSGVNDPNSASDSLPTENSDL